jgi:hypothetical protein
MFAEFFQNESCRVQFEQFVNAWIQYALLPATAIVRGCSTGANHAKNCRPTSSDLKTRVAIAGDVQEEHEVNAHLGSGEDREAQAAGPEQRRVCNPGGRRRENERHRFHGRMDTRRGAWRAHRL